MEIFYYCQVDLSGQTGSIGSVRHVLEVAERISSRGHEVTLFAPEPAGDVTDPKVDNIVYFNSTPGKLGFLLSILDCSWKIIRHFIRGRPDIFYAREMLYTFHTVLLALLFGVPHVCEINGFQPEEIKTDSNYSKILFPLLITAEALNYWLSTALLAVSETTRRKVIDYYQISSDKIVTIRNGVNTNRCYPMKEEQLQKKETIPQIDGLCAGFVGYLFPWSGVEYIIRAAPLVLEKFPEANFLIVGGGTWGAHLPRLAEEKEVGNSFFFTGTVPWPEVPYHLNLMDIGLAPYTTERDTLDSLKIYEYMACGLPVISADLPELRDLIQDNKLGFVFEPENSEQLAQKIIRLFDNTQKRKKMGKQARKVAVENYDWNNTVKETESLFQNLN